jgi:hypothetical protein
MKKVIISALCLVISITNFGQTKTNSGNDFFNKKVSLGIVIGIGQSVFKATESNWAQTNLKDSFNSIKSKNGVLVIVGQEVKVKLNNIISYRQRILLNFESSTLEFDNKKSGIQKLNLQNVVITAPIHFMFQSNYEKYRPFVLLGSTLKYNLGQDKDVKDKFQIKPFDMTVDLGIGIEIKMKKFLLAPEINFSQGLFNIQNNIGTNYSNTISKLSRQNVILTIAVR